MSEKIYCKFCKRELGPIDSKLGWHPECKEIIDKYGINLDSDNIKYFEYFVRLYPEEYNKLERLINYLGPDEIINSFDLLKKGSHSYDSWNNKVKELNQNLSWNFIIILNNNLPGPNSMEYSEYDRYSPFSSIYDSSYIKIMIKNFKLNKIEIYRHEKTNLIEILNILGGGIYSELKIKTQYIPDLGNSLSILKITDYLSILSDADQFNNKNVEFDGNFLNSQNTLQNLELLLNVKSCKIINFIKKNQSIKHIITNAELTNEFKQFEKLEILELKNTFFNSFKIINFTFVQNIKKLKIDLRFDLFDGEDKIIGKTTKIQDLEIKFSCTSQKLIFDLCPELKRLKIFFNGQLEEIGEIIQKMIELKHLESLDLELTEDLNAYLLDNSDNLNDCYLDLKKLILSNVVTSIPLFVFSCKKLEVLMLKPNKRIQQISNLDRLKALPHLKKIFIPKSIRKKSESFIIEELETKYKIKVIS